jgi:hypothetical protein
MNSGVNVNDPTVIAAFKSALLHQGNLCAADLRGARAGVGHRAGVVARSSQLATRDPQGRPRDSRAVLAAGAADRLRLPWVFDGILQAQPKMAIRLPSQVIQPGGQLAALGAAPGELGGTLLLSPMQAGAAAVWIQIGIGIWLVAAPLGRWSRW